MVNESWVDDLVAECEHVETPQSWLWWSFLTCISAAAGNNYYLTTLKGDVVYRPNLYVMLLGASGLGKGFPISRAHMLVDRANVTRVIKGRSSIQAIVKELATTRTSKDKPPMTDSRGFIVNGELSTAIIADPDALTILTDLFDGNYNREWSNLLKGDGAEKLKNPYITALFGSSPAHFYDSIPQANIDGGYIGRNLIVYEEKRAKDVDLLDERRTDDRPETDKFDSYITPKYVPHLQRISDKSAVLYPDESTRHYFNSWRREWRKSQIDDKTGFINRVPDHVLKVAMCICLSRYNNVGIIDELDIREAISRVTSLVYANKKTTEGRGLDPLAQQSKMVLDFLIAAPDNELRFRVLLSRGLGQWQTAQLNQIIDTLLEMGYITREKHIAGPATDWIIKLAGEPLAAYKRYLASQNGHLK